MSDPARVGKMLGGPAIGSYRVRWWPVERVWRVQVRVLDRLAGQVVAVWKFHTEGEGPKSWGQQLLQVTGQSPYGYECDCYPWGVSPENYEGPQRRCLVHGENPIVRLEEHQADWFAHTWATGLPMSWGCAATWSDGQQCLAVIATSSGELPPGTQHVRTVVRPLTVEDAKR